MLAKIAVTYETDGTIFQHFGHTQQFKVYTIDVDDKKVVSSEVIGNDGMGHEALAGLLEKREIIALICGGIGAGAVNALEYNGIRVLGGCSGNADAAMEKLLNGTLIYSDRPNCTHHDEGGCGNEENCEEKGGCCH